MNSIEGPTIVINGVTEPPAKLQSWRAGAQVYKLQFLEDGLSDNWISRATSDACLPRIRYVEALCDLPVHK